MDVLDDLFMDNHENIEPEIIVSNEYVMIDNKLYRHVQLLGAGGYFEDFVINDREIIWCFVYDSEGNPSLAAKVMNYEEDGYVSEDTDYDE